MQLDNMETHPTCRSFSWLVGGMSVSGPELPPPAGWTSPVPLSEVELPLGDRKAFVNDRDHFVDFFFADHERWAELD